MRKLLTLISITIISSTLSSQNLSMDKTLSYSFTSTLSAHSNDGGMLWVENERGVRNIYYALPPSYKPHQLTNYSLDDGYPIDQMAFYDNGKKVIFVRGGRPNRKGEFPNPTLDPDGTKREILSIDIESKSISKIAEGNHPLIIGDSVLYLNRGKVFISDFETQKPKLLFSIRGSVGSLRLSPNEEQIAFTNRRSDHSFIGIYHLRNRSIHLLNPSLSYDSDPVWSPDGKYLAYLRIPSSDREFFKPRRKKSPFSILVHDIKKNHSNTIFTAEEGTGSFYSSIAAENQIFWTSKNEIIFPWEKTGWKHLYAISLVDKKLKNITLGKFEVQDVFQSPDRSKLVFSSNQDDINRSHIWSYHDNKLKQLTSGLSLEWSPVIDGNGNIFCLGSSARVPAHVKMINGNDLRSLNKDSDYLSNTLIKPKAVKFTSSDGLVIHGQLFIAEEIKENKKVPALIFLHGGPRNQMLLGFHKSRVYHHMYAVNQHLALKGYVVLSINFRSGTGYGMEFREAIGYGARGATEYEDILAAADFLHQHPNVQEENIGLWGGSYGGYLTALGLARNSDIFAAGVNINGVYNWNNIWKDKQPLARPEAELTQLINRSSPSDAMESWKSPILIIHADDDRNVPFSESIQLAEALREHGIYFESLIFPNEVHGYLLHKSWVEAFEATEDFFNRKLKKE